MARQKLMNVGRWHRIMEESRLTATVVASPSIIFYTTGALLPSQLKSSPNLAARLVDDRAAFAVVPADGEPVLIVSSRDLPGIRSATWSTRINAYADCEENAVDALREVLRSMGLNGERVGLESAYITAADARRLRAEEPTIDFVPCDAEINLIRAVKTPVEIDILRKAGELTAEAIWQGFQSSKAGDTEKELADRISAALFDHGADDIYLSVLGAGSNTFFTHNKPGNKELEAGDLVRTDFGGKFEGYASDLARMGCVGTPSKRQSEMYEICREVQLGTIETIRPGVEAREIYENCRRLFAARGFDLKFPHVGHAFAMGGHDYPMFYPGDRTPLEVDMVFYVEPVMGQPGIGLFQIEDLVRVTPSGPQILTGARDNSTLWSIRG